MGDVKKGLALNIDNEGAQDATAGGPPESALESGAATTYRAGGKRKCQESLGLAPLALPSDQGDIMHRKKVAARGQPPRCQAIGSARRRRGRVRRAGAARWNKGRAAIFTVRAVSPRLQLLEL
jgi:hypothetical protein